MILREMMVIVSVTSVIKMHRKSVLYGCLSSRKRQPEWFPLSASVALKCAMYQAARLCKQQPAILVLGKEVCGAEIVNFMRVRVLFLARIEAAGSVARIEAAGSVPLFSLMKTWANMLQNG